MNSIFHFLHSYHPQPILFSWGNFHIYWYGVFISLAVGVGIALTVFLSKKFSLSWEKVFDISVYTIVFALIGARIYHVFIEWPYYFHHPLNVFKFWQGGIAIHGAILGGLLGAWFLNKKYKIKLWLLADIATPALALGQAIGRWGNYFNQELFGYPTSSPWGIPIAQPNRPFGYLNYQFFHPCFLYESLLDFFNFLFLLFLLYQKQKNRFPRLLKTGNIFLIYLLNYSLIRFLLEFIRIDKTALLWGIRFPQLLSLLLFIFIVLGLGYRILTTKPSSS